ncbi:MAG: outer membrane protein assembly factor BamE [Gammaproteobacteria bacterium]|nr:outer membrane protein assembly factor BamE [Gammaproteobacteria bacterium]
MQKLLIYIACYATLLLSGCSIDLLSWTHRIDIQQGNIIAQEDVDQLRPGMNKNQVRFIMGTALIQDPFHTDRWDYVYTQKKGSGEYEKKRMSVEFVDGRLARIFGDVHPNPNATPRITKPSSSVNVPHREKKEKSFFDRVMDSVTAGPSSSTGGGGGGGHTH